MRQAAFAQGPARFVALLAAEDSEAIAEVGGLHHRYERVAA